MNRFLVVVILHALAGCLNFSQTADMVYTPPPKTKECIEREQTVIVLNLYEGFLNLSQNMFAITNKGARNFKDLVTYNEEVLKQQAPKCKRKLPKFAKCKFDEVADILKRTTCSALSTTPMPKNVTTWSYGPMHDRKKAKTYKQDVKGGKKRNFLDKLNDEEKKQFKYKEYRRIRIMENDDEDDEEENENDDDKDEDEDDEENKDDDEDEDDEENKDDDEDEDEDVKRKQHVYSRNKRSLKADSNKSSREKRAIKDGQLLIGNNRELTKVRRCYKAGSISRNKNLRMTRSCSATTTLPENRFPRFLNEVICDFQDGGCLHNEGVVIQRVVFIQFKIDVHRNLTVARLGSWQDYQQKIRTSCECQVRRSSILSGYVS